MSEVVSSDIQNLVGHFTVGSYFVPDSVLVSMVPGKAEDVNKAVNQLIQENPEYEFTTETVYSPVPGQMIRWQRINQGEKSD